LLVAIVPPLRASFRPWRFGRVSTFTIVATLVIIVGSDAMLVVFHVFNRNALNFLSMLVPHRMLGSIFIAGVVASVLTDYLRRSFFAACFSMLLRLRLTIGLP
jgi:hypothetical protein